MRAYFEIDHADRVVVTYDAEDDAGVTRVTRTFTCSPNGGYVKEITGGVTRQVCAKLSHYGDTLWCNSRSDLLKLIRREYTAMRRAAKREAMAE